MGETSNWVCQTDFFGIPKNTLQLYKIQVGHLKFILMIQAVKFVGIIEENIHNKN